MKYIFFFFFFDKGAMDTKWYEKCKYLEVYTSKISLCFAQS